MDKLNHIIQHLRIMQVEMRKLADSLAKYDISCKKCGGEMKQGQAIAQTVTGSPDFAGGEYITMSPGGTGKLIECMKCEKCGWSVNG